MFVVEFVFWEIKLFLKKKKKKTLLSSTILGPVGNHPIFKTWCSTQWRSSVVRIRDRTSLEAFWWVGFKSVVQVRSDACKEVEVNVYWKIKFD